MDTIGSNQPDPGVETRRLFSVLTMRRRTNSHE
jgi:hypothetical protein